MELPQYGTSAISLATSLTILSILLEITVVKSCVNAIHVSVLLCLIIQFTPIAVAQFPTPGVLLNPDTRIKEPSFTPRFNATPPGTSVVTQQPISDVAPQAQPAMTAVQPEIFDGFSSEFHMDDTTQLVQPFAPAVVVETVCVPRALHGVFGEFLMLQARDAEVAFAVPQNGLGVGAVPVGPVAVADPAYEPGFRAGGFWALDQNSRLFGTYTWYESDTNASIATPGAGVLVNPLVLLPGTVNAGLVFQPSSANYEIDFQHIDIDYQVFATECCDRYWYGYLLGARYAQLNQDFRATFNYAPPDGVNSLVTAIDFDGIGFRLGLEGERRVFPNGRLRVYGRGVANFLFGEFNASYVQRNETTNLTVGTTSFKKDVIVPLTELELGLAWVSDRQRVRISGGYMLNMWFNTFTTPDWIRSVQQGFQSPDGTLTFDGLTARLEVRF